MTPGTSPGVVGQSRWGSPGGKHIHDSACGGACGEGAARSRALEDLLQAVVKSRPVLRRTSALAPRIGLARQKGQFRGCAGPGRGGAGSTELVCSYCTRRPLTYGLGPMARASPWRPGAWDYRRRAASQTTAFVRDWAAGAPEGDRSTTSPENRTKAAPGSRSSVKLPG